MKHDNSEILALLARIADGEERAMKQFYDANADLIYRYIVARSGDTVLAADILNEVMLQVWRHPQGFEGRSKLSTWLIGIGRHKLLDHYRRQSRHQARHEAEALDEQLEDDSPDACCAVASEQLAGFIRDCVERLAAAHREVVHLAFFEEMAYPEIASVIGCPVGTIKSRIHHAKEKLRQCVQHLGMG